MADSAGMREVWAATHVGHKRSNNEDRGAVPGWTSSGGNEIWNGRISSVQGWAMIADGMGGHDAGEYASEIALASVSAGIGSAGSRDKVAVLLKYSNDSVFTSMMDPRGRPGMGSTIVGVKFCGTSMLVFNVGDSRAYALERNQLRQLSTDDSAPARTVFRSHALTQSLGGSTRRLEIRPHVVEFVASSETSILLCSDGLSDLLPDAEIASIALRNPQRPAEALVSAALDAGGDDNITVIYIGCDRK
ncbi:PP2C family protein-serine/threonine phosphatase [Rhizobium leguminosarum]